MRWEDLIGNLMSLWSWTKPHSRGVLQLALNSTPPHPPSFLLLSAANHCCLSSEIGLNDCIMVCQGNSFVSANLKAEAEGLLNSRAAGLT